MSRVLDFLFPPACPICGDRVSTDGIFCDACYADFDWIVDPKCNCCGYPFASVLEPDPKRMCPICAAGKNELDQMRSACVYDEFSRNVMLPFKHAAALRYGRVMSHHMIFAMGDMKADFDLIIPVPLAKARLFKRGYNQATLLAKPISKHFGCPVDTKTITRKYRPDMGHKNAKQRAENIHGVFTVTDPDKIVNKTILLVDDVMTTGATFSELHRVLKRAGARAVYGVVFCRVVRAI